MATFGYGRVSTQDQTTDNQRLEIERAGYSIDYWFADEGVSGAVLAAQRPQFRDMLTQDTQRRVPRRHEDRPARAATPWTFNRP